MASIARMEVTLSASLNDITKDLPSLHFENALSSKEKEPYSILRKRSHAVTVAACAQASYFVAILNEARQKILDFKTPQLSKTSKFLQQAPPRDAVKVGIIGCGRIGSHLANTLLTYGDVLPQELQISTRRPEILTHFKNKGTECVYDNAKVASAVHLLFLCVLPSQLNIVAEDIHGILPDHCTVYAFLSSVPIQRLRRILEFKNIIRPEFIWQQDGAVLASDHAWDCTKDVCCTLESQSQVEVTCPLAGKDNSIVQTKEKWAEMILYSFVNMCTMEGLEREQAIRVTNEVVLGQFPNREYPTEFRAFNFTRRLNLFPVFDISAVADKETPLTQTVTENQELRNMFINKYKSIFDKFYYWKGIKQVKPKSLREVT